MFVSGERWDERGVPIGLDCFVLALRGFQVGAGIPGLGQSLSLIHIFGHHTTDLCLCVELTLTFTALGGEIFH